MLGEELLFGGFLESKDAEFFCGVGGSEELFVDNKFAWRLVFEILALREKALVKELRSCE